MYKEKVEITYLDGGDIKKLIAEKYGVHDESVDIDISEVDHQHPNLSVIAVVRKLITEQ